MATVGRQEVGIKAISFLHTNSKMVPPVGTPLRVTFVAFESTTKAENVSVELDPNGYTPMPRWTMPPPETSPQEYQHHHTTMGN